MKVCPSYLECALICMHFPLCSFRMICSKHGWLLSDDLYGQRSQCEYNEQEINLTMIYSLRDEQSTQKRVCVGLQVPLLHICFVVNFTVLCLFLS